MLANELAALFVRDLTRLRQEIEAFPDTATLWATAPGISNAAGTLALHLEGNLREYIGRQLAHVDYRRDRPAEFSTRGVSREELARRAGALREEIPAVIASLSDAELSATFPEMVLGAPTSTRQFLIHLSGHLNYHLGQIDYLRRVSTGSGALVLAELAS
ncbi:MAG: DinB family protein [Vicinamibacterales bacterium]